MPQTITELLAAGEPGAPAIASPGRDALTYAQLRSEIDRLAGQLRAAGVGRGDRVAIVLPNGPQAAIAFLAVASCAAAAPLNPAYREPEFRFALDDLGAKALITRPGGASQAHAAAAAGVCGWRSRGSRAASALRTGDAAATPARPARAGAGRCGAGRCGAAAAHVGHDLAAEARAAQPAQPGGVGPGTSSNRWR